MKVYFETNFVLELALLQEQHESCSKLLSLSEQDVVEMAMPVFCVAEAYETLIRRSKQRMRLAQDLINELRQLARSQPYKSEIDAFQNITGLLVRSTQEEDARLAQALDRMLKCTTLIILDANVLSSAGQARSLFKLQPQDSIVYASIAHHLASSRGESCFLNRNKNDFDDPDIEEDLKKLGCKVLFSFDDGYHYVSHKTRPLSS